MTEKLEFVNPDGDKSIEERIYNMKEIKDRGDVSRMLKQISFGKNEMSLDDVVSSLLGCERHILSFKDDDLVEEWIRCIFIKADARWVSIDTAKQVIDSMSRYVGECGFALHSIKSTLEIHPHKNELRQYARDLQRFYDHLKGMAEIYVGADETFAFIKDLHRSNTMIKAARP